MHRPYFRISATTTEGVWFLSSHAPAFIMKEWNSSCRIVQPYSLSTFTDRPPTPISRMSEVAGWEPWYPHTRGRGTGHPNPDPNLVPVPSNGNPSNLRLWRSHLWKVVKVKVKSLSCVRLFGTLWAVAHQAPPSVGFSRQGYWSGLPFPSPGDLPHPGIEPRSPALQADALISEPPGKPLKGGSVRLNERLVEQIDAF